MQRRTSVMMVSLGLLGLPAMGCQKVLDVVHRLTGGTNGDGAGPEGATPTAHGQPESAQPEGAPSSVRTPATVRATGCPALLANAALTPGTVHNNTVSHDETWTLEDSPHRLPDGVTVQTGATLTIAPCAVVLVGNGNGVLVRSGAGLVAVGDAQHPVRFGSDNAQPQPGGWQAVAFEENARNTSRFSHAVIEHGGGDWGGENAGLIVRLTGLHADHLTLRANRAFGIELRDRGSFSDDSGDVTVTGTAAVNAALTGAVWVQNAPQVASLPAGAYTGNAIDEVFIAYATAGSDLSTIRQSATWKNLGVPYHLADGQDLRVDGPTGPVLTIAAGTTIRFGRDAGISVGYDAEGGLVMDGNADETRIVLRPAGTDESPAQWHGVYFGPRFNRSASRMRFVTLRNAGSAWNGQLCDWQGTSGDNPFVMFEAAPPADHFTHLTFAVAGPDGVAFGRKWNGAPVDLAAASQGHDFSQFGAPCHQSPVADANGACPDPAPACP